MHLFLELASVGFYASGVLAFVLGAAGGAGWTIALRVSLELWMAAGLLRLTADPSWGRIAETVSILAIRQLATWRAAPAPPARHRRSAERGMGP